jgi:hypothetical protein
MTFPILELAVLEAFPTIALRQFPVFLRAISFHLGKIHIKTFDILLGFMKEKQDIEVLLVSRLNYGSKFLGEAR